MTGEEHMAQVIEGRHPSTAHLAGLFTRQPAPPAVQRKMTAVREACLQVAAIMVLELPDGPELSAGLRHLLEAKDAFCRAALE